MAVRNILTDNEPLLRKKSRVVEKFDDRLHALLDDMKDTLRSVGGVGLAAPQVGILKRVVIVDFEEDNIFMELVNPEITESRGSQCEVEACLSVPLRQGKVIRPAKVVVKAQDRFGEWHEYEGEDLLARCFCHELDHLDGVLYIDKIAPGEEITYTEYDFGDEE
ncbi:MAG TPA: peptide deformylase [Clostridiales bacterium]|nr:peptide deformylase [Clostridiales bacterium]